MRSVTRFTESNKDFFDADYADFTQIAADYFQLCNAALERLNLR